jgi:hypothetical protein
LNPGVVERSDATSRFDARENPGKSLGYLTPTAEIVGVGP